MRRKVSWLQFSSILNGATIMYKIKDMGFFGNIISSAVKVALTPVAVVADAVKVVSGEEADTTKNLIESAGDDVSNAFDSI